MREIQIVHREEVAMLDETFGCLSVSESAETVTP